MVQLHRECDAHTNPWSLSRPTCPDSIRRARIQGGKGGKSGRSALAIQEKDVIDWGGELPKRYRTKVNESGLGWLETLPP